MHNRHEYSVFDFTEWNEITGIKIMRQGKRVREPHKLIPLFLHVYLLLIRNSLIKIRIQELIATCTVNYTVGCHRADI